MNRRGFTLIELMVVLGIILVLVAIVVLGLRHVNSQAASRETQSEMVILNDWITEFRNVHGSLGEMTTVAGTQVTSGIEMAPVKRQDGTIVPPFPVPAGMISPMQVNALTLPVFLDANPEVISGQPQTALTNDDFAGQGSGLPGNRDMGDRLSPTTARYLSNAVQWTLAVNYVLLREPKNRSVLASSVPAKRLLEIPSKLTLPNGFDPLTAAVILDGWGNPIVYVPRGGMHVTLNTSGTLSDWVVRSSGTLPLNKGTPPVSANDQPFFASAGQDGVFTDTAAGNGASADYASDNLYSFQR